MFFERGVREDGTRPADSPALKLAIIGAVALSLGACTAREQNDRVRQFPGNLLASTFGFGAIAYFELDSTDERNVPSVANLMN